MGRKPKDNGKQLLVDDDIEHEPTLKELEADDDINIYIGFNDELFFEQDDEDDL